MPIVGEGEGEGPRRCVRVKGGVEKKVVFKLALFSLCKNELFEQREEKTEILYAP